VSDADAPPGGRFPHETVLDCSYDDSEAAALVATSLRQDIDRIDGDRSTAAVAHEGDTVRVTVRAVDERAREFYRSRGFDERTRLPEHYEDCDGLLLVCELR